MNKVEAQPIPDSKPEIELEDRILDFFKFYKAPIILWLGWRIALFIFPILGGTLFMPTDTEDTYPVTSSLLLERLIGTWTHWDGAVYIDIATKGYTDLTSVSFYPLYPLLLRVLSFVFTLGGFNYFAVGAVGIVISSIFALITCLLLFKLVSFEYDGETARLSVLYLLAFPTAFFLFAVYTESFFLALAIGAFYAARREKWSLAILLACLTVLTKNQGILVVVALAVEYAQQIGWNPRRLDRRAIFFTLPVIAFGGWLGFNWLSYGNPFAFIAALSHWNRVFTWPWDTLIAGAGRFEAPLVIAFLLILALAIRPALKGEIRLTYFIFFVITLMQPLLNPIVESPLRSVIRYQLIIFPAFFLLAKAGKRSPVFHYTYLVFCLLLAGGLLTRFILFFWVA